MTGTEPRWHMPNERTLVVQRDTADGVRTTTYEWNEPPTDDIIMRALSERSSPDMVKQDGQGLAARRFRLRWGWSIYLHHAWGPPRWTFPRLLPKAQPGRYEIAAGWLFHCYGICIRKDTT